MFPPLSVVQSDKLQMCIYWHHFKENLHFFLLTRLSDIANLIDNFAHRGLSSLAERKHSGSTAISLPLHSPLVGKL